MTTKKAKKPSSHEPISVEEEILKGQQSVIFKELLTYGDHTLQISIKSDAYDFQSYAKLERWDGNKWQLVCSRHHSIMNTPFKLYVSQLVTKRVFLLDRRSLINSMKLILS